MITNLRISRKLAIPAIILGLVAAAVVWYGMLGLGTLNGVTVALTRSELPRLLLALKLKTEITKAHSVLLELIVTYEQTDAEMKASLARFDAEIDQVKSGLDQLATSAAAADAELIEQTTAAAEEYRRFTTARVFPLASNWQTVKAFNLVRTEGVKRAGEINAQIDKLVEITRASVDALGDRAAEVHRATARHLVIGSSIGLGIAFGFLAWIARFQLAKPLAAMASRMSRLAEGDLEIEVVGTERRDEIGSLARSLQVFKENTHAKRALEAAQLEEQQAKQRQQQAILESIKAFEGSVRGALETLGAAAGQMQRTAETLSLTAQAEERQSAEAAQGAEQASANVQAVTAALTELNATIGEVASQVDHSTRIAGAAIEVAHHMEGDIQALTDAAERVGSIVLLISNIAAQTNLLALNATIEAARAGDAGKGFAVVAGEVKSLATQTAQATTEIAGQISAMQSATLTVIDAIKRIHATIEQMNSICAVVAGATQQQAAATQEISQRVQEAAVGTDEVSKSIAGVSAGTHETQKAATEVLASATELGQQTAALRGGIDAFLDDIRAA
jgi:methyl-accepting chemotaxis protein